MLQNGIKMKNKKGGKIIAIILGVISLPLFGIVCYSTITGVFFSSFADAVNGVIILLLAIMCAILSYRRWMQSNLSNSYYRKSRKLDFFRFIKVLFASFTISLVFMNVIMIGTYLIFYIDKPFVSVLILFYKLHYGIYIFTIILFPLVNKYYKAGRA